MTVHKCYVSVISGNVQKKVSYQEDFLTPKKKKKKRTPKMIRLLAQTYTSVPYKTNLVLDVIHLSIINLVILYPDSMFFWYGGSTEFTPTQLRASDLLLTLVIMYYSYSAQMWVSVSNFDCLSYFKNLYYYYFHCYLIIKYKEYFMCDLIF